jgi:hypothetical protein
MAEPSGARNLSQAMFMMDEKIMKNQNNLSSQLKKNEVSAWNSIAMP